MRKYCVTICISLISLLGYSSYISADSTTSVFINEFLANPIGEDQAAEWIELYNPNSVLISLDGWALSDIYGSVKNFPLNGKTLSAFGYLVLYRSETQITQNNDNEQLVLTNPEGNTFTTAVASNLAEGQSYALVGSNWNPATPTPGATNEPMVSPIPTPSASPPHASPSPTPTSTNTPTPSPSPLTAQSLELSEILACGASTEWVELYNPNDFHILLDGWKIQDSTTQSKPLDGMSIPPKGYVVKEWSGYFLNNGGDEVRLFEGEELVDTFTYNTCAARFSWVKRDDHWEQTSTLTKNAPNVFDEQKSVEDREEHASTPSSPSAAPSTPAPPTSVFFDSLPLSSRVYPGSFPSLVLIGQHTDPRTGQAVAVSPNTTADQQNGSHIAFSWFLSGGFWLWSSASLLIRNGTMDPYVRRVA